MVVNNAEKINSMKNIFKLSALAVLAVGLLASCEKKELSAPEVAVGEVNTFTLTFAQPDTKVAISDAGKTTWEAGDEILIHGEGGSNKTIVTLKAEDISADGKEAKISFSGVKPYDRFSDRGYTSVYYAQYPASASAAADYNYYYYAAFANTNAPLMAAYNVGSAFVFHNLCGVISFKVDGDYDSYTFEGNNGETVGYTLYRSRLAAKGEEDPVLEYKYSTSGDQTSIDGAITPGKTAYIGLPLGVNLTKGFTITLKKDGAVAGVAKTSTAVNVERGKLLPLGDITSKVVGVYAFDYTPSEAYLASTNLWKAVFDANGEEVSGNIAGYEVKGIADVPAIVKNQSTYKFHFNGATTGDWANCNFLAPVPANAIPLAAGKQYNFSFTVAASKALPRMFLKMTTYDASKTANHEGGYVWETTKALEAETPITVTDVINGVACDNISFTLDFGGNPEDVDIYLKDIVIEEVVVPAKFQWREDSVAEQTAAYNTPGAAHWYIDADADVEWNAVVKLDGVETTEAVTVEHFDVGGGHIAINYATNETLADKVWEITVTTEANVENKTLTAKLTQGAYEYTDLAKFNADIIADGDKTVDRILNISADAKLYVTKKDKVGDDDYIFAQSKHDYFTGGILLYKTGSGLGEANTIYGKVTATTKLNSGAPVITKLTYAQGDVTTGYDGNIWPCEAVTIADLKANYNKYINAKVKILNSTITKGFKGSSSSGERSGQLKDNTGTIAIYTYLKDQLVGGEAGWNLNQLICWPFLYNTNQQVLVWSDGGVDVKNATTTISVAESKTLSLTGDPVTLVATSNSPKKGFVFSSDNTNVVEVDPATGVLTPKAEGNAKITVSLADTTVVTEKANLYKASNNRSVKYLGATAECAVTVQAEAIVVPDPVEFDTFSNTFEKSGSGNEETATLTSGDITVSVLKGTGTAFRNSDSDHVRFYQNVTVTVASAANKISSIEFTCTSASYATALANCSFSHGTAVADGTKVTVSNVSASTTSAVMGAQTRVSHIKVIYE